jgi:hypothetical protein
MSRMAKIAIIGLLALVLLACLATFSYVKYVRVMGHLDSLQQHLRGLEARGQEDLFADLKREQLNEVRSELVQIGDDLRGLKSQLAPVLIVARFLGWLPRVGPDVAAAPDLLEIGIGITTAGDLVFEGLDPLLAVLEGSQETSSQESIGERVTAALVEGQPQFIAAQAELDEVRQRRERIDDEHLMPKVVQLLERLDKYLPLLDTGVQVLIIAPDLLGAEEPRTYLLLAQNDNELRATGGFISSVALLRITDGRIEELDFRDSYAVDDLSKPHPLAPKPLEKYMLAQIWLIRDANWYPDFPSTAQVARDLYELDQGVLVDGVIAADLVAMQSLVAALGPIQLEEYGVEVNAANVMTLMQEYWASPGGEGQSGAWWLHRKDFMGEVLAAMLTKLETDVGSMDLSALIELLGRGFEEKHILIYLADPTVSEIMAENQLDGAVRSNTGDFLMVVDTNMGFNKVNPNIESSVDYQVLINEDGSLTIQVTVRYRNKSTVAVAECVQEARYPPTYQEMMEGCYWNYLRVYAPEEAQLLQGTELTLPEGSLRARESDLAGTTLSPEVGPVEAGKNVFATFFVVPPGEEREIAFQYELPSDTLQREGSTARYTLLVQKQPGTLSVPLHVTVSLPPGSEAMSAQPSATSLTYLEAEFETDLRVDREFEVVLWLEEASQ